MTINQKKSLIILVIISLILSILSCNSSTNNTPDIQISIENGTTDVDPAEVSFIDVKFSKTMDTRPNGFISVGGIKYDICEHYWLNSYTYRILLDLRYDRIYKIVLNDIEYGEDHPDWKEEYFFRDIDGNFIKEFPIEFSTITSQLKHPCNFLIDFTKDNSLTGKFIKDSNNTQQLLIPIKKYLNHETLEKGDSLTIKYIITSENDIGEIKANIYDKNRNTDSWVKLNTVNVTAVKNYKASSNSEKPNLYENEITFEIAENMLSTAEMQLWSKYDSEHSLITINSVLSSDSEQNSENTRKIIAVYKASRPSGDDFLKIYSDGTWEEVIVSSLYGTVHYGDGTYKLIKGDMENGKFEFIIKHFRTNGFSGTLREVNYKNTITVSNSIFEFNEGIYLKQ